jgi:hypothetical protein
MVAENCLKSNGFCASAAIVRHKKIDSPQRISRFLLICVSPGHELYSHQRALGANIPPNSSERQCHFRDIRHGCFSMAVIGRSFFISPHPEWPSGRIIEQWSWE